MKGYLRFVSIGLIALTPLAVLTQARGAAIDRVEGDGFNFTASLKF
jgi:hypothetical protein